MANEIITSDYQKLASDLSSIIQKGQQEVLSAVNQIRLQTYWDMGKRLNETLATLSAEQAAAYYIQLATDLKLDKTLLYRINMFFRTWPDGVPSVDGAVISWTHHVELLSIKDKDERQFYLEAASAQKWGRSDLRKAIEKDYYESIKSGESTASTTIERPVNPMHVYKAVVEKVVDGDTLLVRIDLGFDVWVNARTRFRGINTEEMTLRTSGASERAIKAKEFVEKKLTDLDFVVIKTYKTDMYGRYVSDVFYNPTVMDKEKVYSQGFFLNQELLKAGLADIMN